jgi:diacylglycerol kinase family enzyme
MPRALVIVNPRARRGAAADVYATIRSEVEAGFEVRHALLDESGEWLRELDRARSDGFERVVAVGGDGTVNAVANAILGGVIGASKEMTVGAVGVGSSNDFHKPRQRCAGGVPIRIGAPLERDAGLATWEDDDGVAHARWFVVSASIGMSARANRRFSQERGVARWLGARSVSAAIAYAALGALASHANVGARLRRTDERSEVDVLVSNLSVMLTPHLAGSFRYDTDVRPGQGSFALHLCEGMGRVELLATMAALLGGRFAGSPRTESWASRTVSLELDREDDLELDGEVYRARRVRFEAFSDVLAVCS